ncbi:MAG TPA: hypothetical protein VJM83_03055 [Nitrospirota bacterium]|nr:hypothetical protein [Nitrospirota bacterium]
MAGAEGIARMLEAVRMGGPEELREACAEIVRSWRDAPVKDLLALKEQFRKMDMEERESVLDEALISVAEKRPGPFTEIVRDPEAPLWRPAAEVLSGARDPRHLELFVSLLPACPRKSVETLIRAVGRYRDPVALAAVKEYLHDADEGVMLEAVMAVREAGGSEGVGYLREALENARRGSAGNVPVLEGVIREMERKSEA